MIISYRAQRVLRQLGAFLLALLVLTALLVLCWFLWLQRYIVYTRDGAKLNFDLPAQVSKGEVALKDPSSDTNIDFVHSDGSVGDEEEKKQLQQFSGYYVTTDDLRLNLAVVKEQMAQLPDGSVIMMEMKSAWGEFYYHSNLGRYSDSADVDAVSDLIVELKNRGHYLIAKVPAFQDYYFFADQGGRTGFGLRRKSGVGLWVDGQRCYRLNPESDGTKTFLIQIATELRAAGFNEVVFSQFQYPTDRDAVVPADPVGALAETAAMLVGTCATDSFAVSFLCETALLPLPEGRSRLYFNNVAAADVNTVAGQTGLDTPETRLVFMTQMNDSRFDAYCVLRPLDTAH